MRLIIYFDCPKQSLGENYKIVQKKGFNQTEIWNFLDCVVSALSFLQSKGGYSGNISLNHIYQVYTPLGFSVFKVIDRFFNNVPQRVYPQFFEYLGDIEKMQSLANSLYLSPKQLESLAQHCKYPKHDIFKSDIFALGMTCLFCLDLKDINDLYDFENFKIKQASLISRVEKLRKLSISNEIVQIIKQMLEIEENKRVDFISLNSRLDQISQFKNLERISQKREDKDYIFQFSQTHMAKLKDQERKSHRHGHTRKLKNRESSIKKTEEDKLQSDIQQQMEEDEGSNLENPFNEDDLYRTEPLIEKNQQIIEDQERALEFKGTILYSNGLKYVGEVMQEQGHEYGYIEGTNQYGSYSRHGFGILLNKNGDKLIEGTFLNNVPDGQIKMWNYQQAKGECFGHFDLEHKNKAWKFFQGNLKLGKKNGFGILEFDNGDVFQGQFTEDKAEGPGEYKYCNDQQIIRGIWSQNKFIEYNG